jgi:hypothetical protein
VTEFSEVRFELYCRALVFQLARSFEKGEKKDVPHSKFIGNSSGVDTNAYLLAHPCAAREGQPRRISRDASSLLGLLDREGNKWR